MRQARGSYSNGFAPRDQRPLYPELWTECIGAWAPCLGATGLTVRDWSGLNKTGTLTSMVTNDDWLLVSGLFALDFDGSNDYVDLPSTATNYQNMSYSFWVIPTSTITVNTESTTSTTGLTGQKYAIAEKYVDGPNCGLGVSVGTNGISVYAHSGHLGGIICPLASYTVTISSTEMTHIAVAVAGATPSIWLNGTLVRTGLTWSYGGIQATNGLAGRVSTYGFFRGQIDDFRIYSRTLNGSEIALLSRRRGIAYDMALRSRTGASAAGDAALRNAYNLLLLGVS